MESTPFQQLESKISNYPYPIVSLLTKYRKIVSDNYGEKHSLLCDIFESTIKLTSVVVLNNLVNNNRLQECFPQGMSFLHHPSLGHWLSILRESSGRDWNNESLLYQIAGWYKDIKAEKKIIDFFADLPEIQFPKGNSLIEGIANSLVAYRNKVWKGHGAAVINETSLPGRVLALEHIIAEFLQHASFFNDINIFYVKEVKKLDNNRYEADCISLKGKDLPYSRVISADFNPDEIYLTMENNVELSRKPLLLSPLVEWKNSNGTFQFYFFNDAKKTKLEYLSYLDGSFYYHKEIKSEFTKIFKINLQKSSEDYEYKLFNFSDEERKEKGELYFKRGLELSAKQQYEGALIALEEAIEWDRKPEYLLQLCNTMLDGGENSQYILETLEYVFEIDPKNAEAEQLKSRLLQADSGETGESEPEDDTGPLNFDKLRFTLFHFFTPRRLREFTTLFCVIALFGFFSAASILVYLIDSSNALRHISIILMHLVESVILVIGVISASNRFVDSYFSLWGQIENMKIERFNIWFQTNVERKFGLFHFTARDKTNTDEDKGSDFGRYRVRFDFGSNRKINILLILFILSFSLAQPITQKLYAMPFSIAAIRFCSGTVLWIILAIFLKYVLGYVLFLKSYSNLELAPVVSKLGTNGFQSISKLYIQSIILIILGWSLNWGWNLLAINNPYYLDSLGLIFALIIAVYYFGFSPIFTKRALRLSKSMVLIDYDDHLKQAFKRFVKDPTKSNVEAFEWLKENQRIVKKVSSRLYNIWQWIIYLIAILVIIGVSVLYIMIRVGYLEGIANFIAKY